jgi:hypothetical protein
MLQFKPRLIKKCLKNVITTMFDKTNNALIVHFKIPFFFKESISTKVSKKSNPNYPCHVARWYFLNRFFV